MPVQVLSAPHPKVACGCGCGGRLTPKDRRGRPRSFLAGHVNKGRAAQRQVKRGRITARTSHERAVKLKAGVRVCQYAHLGGCLGVLDVAHVDGNEFNNARTNLLKLCRAHHRLVDNGKIDPRAPVMPAFYVDGSGKRRYA